MLAIRNYGHFWSRSHVEWGRPGQQGNLLGYYLRDRQPFRVDFRHQIGIYVLFTAQREAVYIGKAGSGNDRLFSRLKAHTRNHLRDRWTNFSWFGLRDYNGTGELSDHQKPDSNVKGTNSSALDEVEAVLIQLLEPRLNKRGGDWGDTQEFLQYVPWEWDEEIPPPLDSSGEYLSSKLDSVSTGISTLVTAVNRLK